MNNQIASLRPQLIKITKYNLWANRMIVGFLKKLEPALLDKEVISSFKTIRATLHHVWDAENIWYNRLNGVSFTRWPSEDFKGSTSEAFEAFIAQSEKLAEYAENLSEDDLSGNLDYRSTEGKPYANNRQDIIAHVVNHSTYHRGQIVTMLRNVGFTQLSSSDYITFVREVG
jgi:uncharacterized damage-inducible protein DinB